MKKIESIFNAIPDHNSAVLITSDVNRRYFTGMKSSAGVVLAFSENAYLLIDFRYFEKASGTVKDCEVLLLTDLKAQLSELLKKHGAKKIYVENESMTLSEFDRYRAMLPDYDFVSSGELSKAIEKMRGIKTAGEIEKIKTAQKIAEKAFDEVLDFISEGKTEREIARFLDDRMLDLGAEGISFDTIALTGENTSLPHGVPGNTAVSDGQFVLMDFGAVYDGYHSDMTRTICVGEPTDEMERVYEIVLNAQKAALNEAKAGITGKKLDSVARDIIASYGFGDAFGHSLGHGVGMEIHEFPNASSKSETILEKNMLVTIEPGIYLPHKFGVRIEDMALISADGCENLTNSVKNLILL